jgi:hypothetical protein
MRKLRAPRALRDRDSRIAELELRLDDSLKAQIRLFECVIDELNELSESQLRLKYDELMQFCIERNVDVRDGDTLKDFMFEKYETNQTGITISMCKSILNHYYKQRGLKFPDGYFSNFKLITDDVYSAILYQVVDKCEVELDWPPLTGLPPGPPSDEESKES